MVGLFVVKADGIGEGRVRMMGNLYDIEDGGFRCVYSALGTEYRGSKRGHLHDIQYEKGMRSFDSRAVCLIKSVIRVHRSLINKLVDAALG